MTAHAYRATVHDVSQVCYLDLSGIPRAQWFRTGAAAEHFAAALNGADDPVLPEGVCRAGDVLMCRGRDLPEGWEWRVWSDGKWLRTGELLDFAWVECRPISKPATEDVPWWEALRDRRRFSSNDSGNGQRIAGCLRATNGWTLTTANGYQRFVNDSSDGTVTVLRESEA